MHALASAVLVGVPQIAPAATIALERIVAVARTGSEHRTVFAAASVIVAAAPAIAPAAVDILGPAAVSVAVAIASISHHPAPSCVLKRWRTDGIAPSVQPRLPTQRDRERPPRVPVPAVALSGLPPLLPVLDVVAEALPAPAVVAPALLPVLLWGLIAELPDPIEWLPVEPLVPE